MQIYFSHLSALSCSDSNLSVINFLARMNVFMLIHETLPYFKSHASICNNALITYQFIVCTPRFTLCSRISFRKCNKGKTSWSTSFMILDNLHMHTHGKKLNCSDLKSIKYDLILIKCTLLVTYLTYLRLEWNHCLMAILLILFGHQVIMATLFWWV